MKFPVPRLLLSAFLQLTIGCSVCGIATSAELQRPAAPPRKCEVRQAVWCIYQGAWEITDRLVEHQKYDRVWIVRGFFQPRAPLVVMEPNGCREGLADSATAIRFDSQFVWEGKSWNKMTVQVKKDGTCDLDILLPKAQSDPTGEAYFSGLPLLHTCATSTCEGSGLYELAARWDTEYRSGKK